jgi:hypothetical protein
MIHIPENAKIIPNNVYIFIVKPKNKYDRNNTTIIFIFIILKLYPGLGDSVIDFIKNIL